MTNNQEKYNHLNLLKNKNYVLKEKITFKQKKKKKKRRRRKTKQTLSCPRPKKKERKNQPAMSNGKQKRTKMRTKSFHLL